MSAAVIDLAEYRKRREATRRDSSVTVAANVSVAPVVWVTFWYWVPTWIAR